MPLLKTIVWSWSGSLANLQVIKRARNPQQGLFPAGLPQAGTYCCPPTPEGRWPSNFSISALSLSPAGEFLPPLKLTRWVCRDELTTKPLPVLEFERVFKLSCSPVSAKLYQASFTLLLSNADWGGKQGTPLPACRKAPSTCRHTDTAYSSPLLRSGSAPCAKSYSLENGTCAKVPTLIKSSFTPAEREMQRDPTSYPSLAFSPLGLGRSTLQYFASQQPPRNVTEATTAEKGSKSLCVAAFTVLSVPRKKEVTTLQTRFSNTGKKDLWQKRAMAFPAKSPHCALT